MDNTQGRDLVLGPFEYAYVRDDTKGKVGVYVGPHKTSLAGTDKPVIFDEKLNRFVPCTVDEAVQPFISVPKGAYVKLKNPARDGQQPESGKISEFVNLSHGETVNIAGPWFQPLWPGQSARILSGHLLRSNQYLICRVYDEDAAKTNWDKAVIKAQKFDEENDEIQNETDEDTKETLKPETKVIQDEGGVKAADSDFDYTTGELFIVNGTDVSFYIPPTGVEVLTDGSKNYVRNAVTLEQLEYCILLDENGNKRYLKGPAVVFPKPTEKFLKRFLPKTANKKVSRKFRAIELNEISGLYIKVIAPYKENGVEYKKGDELFITGKEQMIYYPRAEHSIIKYGDQEIHYAVAIPAGEARYVLNRMTGNIHTKIGPAMLLPDPRYEVIVKRVLDERQSFLWFPGNNESANYNKALAGIAESEGTDYVTEGAVRSKLKSTKNKKLLKSVQMYDSMLAEFSNTGESQFVDFEDEDAYIDDMQKGFSTDALTRKTAFTKPREIVIDSKYEGAVKIQPWTGYAVQVIDGQGKRKVIAGPAIHFLGYDETLEKIVLSRGVPKSQDNLKQDVYLRVLNNSITDRISAETKDMVEVNVKVIYKVDFTGDKEKWFNVENFVQYLCDSCRSIIRNKIKQMNIQEFHDNHIDAIRDAIMGTKKVSAEITDEDGKKRKTSTKRGRFFDENGMFIKDVEVVDKEVLDAEIEELLEQTQYKVAQLSIEGTLKEKEVELIKVQHEAEKKLAKMDAELKAAREESARSKIQEEMKTQEEVNKAESASIMAKNERVIKMTEGDNQIKLLKTQGEIEDKKTFYDAKVDRQKQLDAITEAEVERRRKENQVELDYAKSELENIIGKINAESKAKVEISKSIQPQLIEALKAVAEAGLLTEVAEHLAPLAIVKGQSIGNVLYDMFQNTPLRATLRGMLPGGKGQMQDDDDDDD